MLKYQCCLGKSVPYAIAQNERGRFVVTSPKGKTWKTTYAKREAAEKGIAYVESRFAGGSVSANIPPREEAESPDTAEERMRLGIPPKEEEEL